LQRVAHTVDRTKRRSERELDVVFDRVQKIRRQRDAERGLDAFEKARRLLAKRRLDDWLEVEARKSGRERLVHDAVGDDFTVDEYAVAVADKVVDHAWRNRKAVARADAIAINSRFMRAV